MMPSPDTLHPTGRPLWLLTGLLLFILPLACTPGPDTPPARDSGIADFLDRGSWDDNDLLGGDGLHGDSLLDDGSTPAPLAPGVFDNPGGDTFLAPRAELLPLWKFVKSARYVGIGESVHGTAAYLATRARLIRAGILDEGFRVIAMETPRTSAEKLETYLQSGNCDSEADAKRAIVYSVFGTFSDQSALPLFQFVCKWNRNHVNDRVHFFGFDMQQPEHDFQIISAFINTYASTDTSLGLSALSPCVTKHSTSGLSEGDFLTCTKVLDGFHTYLTSHAATVFSSVPRKELDKADLAIRSLRGYNTAFYWDPTYNALFPMKDPTDMVEYIARLNKASETRDKLMAEIFSTRVAHDYPSSRVFLLAHNTHLAKRHDEGKNEEPSFGPLIMYGRTMGTILGETYGETYAAIAGIGDAIYIKGSDGKPMLYHLSQSSQALETRLLSFGKKHLFVDAEAPFVGTSPTVLHADIFVVRHAFRALYWVKNSQPAVSLQP